MKRLAIILLACISLASCDKGSKKNIIGKWYGVSQEIPSLDSIMNVQMRFLDTVGQSTTPEQEKLLYDTDNLDSLVKEEKASLEFLVKEQKQYMKATKLEFRKDGVVIYNLSNRVDSANWELGEDNELIFDEMKLKGAGNKTLMHIEQLADTVMTLRFSENDFSGTITFNKEK